MRFLHTVKHFWIVSYRIVSLMAVSCHHYLKLKVRKFESHLILRIEEYIVWKFQFCNVFIPIKMNNAFKSVEKEVILSWKSLENHSQISVRTLSLPHC